jgi:Phosphopantothenate-cysteine ligase (EC 6.3.2.5)/Phosphopantothenoylcysteine decarboxylase (EC 4.1.1.36)
MTAGPTVEQIDPIRAITNQSTGKTGVSLAKELVSAGAKVTFVYGPGNEIPPKGAKIINVVTSKEMFDVVKKELKNKFDIVIMAAAISDYIPKNPSKKKLKVQRQISQLASKKAPKNHK